MAKGAGRTPEGTFETNSSLEKNSLEFIDLEKLEGVVRDMEYIDKKVTTTKDDIYDAKNQLDREWDGDAAAAFILQFGRLNDDLKDFEGGFKDIKTLLQEASNAFRETDRDLYRQFDEAAQKKSSGSSESAPQKEGPRPDLYSTVEAAKDAVLEAADMTEKQELYSTMEAADPADLTKDRRQQKAELYSTMEEERPAQFETARRTPRSELTSTTEDVVNGQYNSGSRPGKTEIQSETGDAKPSDVMNTLLKSQRPELYSVIGDAVAASLTQVARGYREELTSVLPGVYSPLLSAVMRDARAELYSTMEAEYFPVFETNRRAYRPDPTTLLFMAVYSYLAGEKRGERAEETSGAEAQIGAAFTNAERIVRAVAGQTITEGVDAKLLAPSVRVRMNDAVNAVLNDMPAVLGDVDARGQRADTAGTLTETAATLMSDYNRGSDTYRDVQKSILTDKTTAILMDSAFTGRTSRDTAIQLGNQVIDQICPSDMNWTPEKKTLAAEKIGTRMTEYTWNRVSYDAARASGLTSTQTVEAVMAENAAAAAVPVV